VVGVRVVDAFQEVPQRGDPRRLVQVDAIAVELVQRACWVEGAGCGEVLEVGAVAGVQGGGDDPGRVRVDPGAGLFGCFEAVGDSGSGVLFLLAGEQVGVLFGAGLSEPAAGLFHTCFLLPGTRAIRDRSRDVSCGDVTRRDGRGGVSG